MTYKSAHTVIPPYPQGDDTFQEPQWMPETDSTNLSTYSGPSYLGGDWFQDSLSKLNSKVARAPYIKWSSVCM